jgi:3-phenylpropionate/trans-cinnamate dioxygenase ferredoxin subunit
MARHIVARTSDIPPGGNKVANVDGRDIVVFHVNGEFFAPLNRCPHEGAPLEKAACEVRSYPVAIESGEVLAEGLAKGPYVAETFPVHIEDSYVIVET